ncbi:hypothetical protein CEP53_003083 [Fusarium sp. AF-6]|nr:hypothetical protein CEP53_003083 [Fusarium sp. AF-6]
MKIFGWGLIIHMMSSAMAPLPPPLPSHSAHKRYLNNDNRYIYLSHCALTTSRTTNFSTALNRPGFSPKMKFQALVVALAAVAMAHHPPGLKEKCGRLGVKEWDPDNLPEGYKLEDIKKCAEYPLEVGYYWGFGEH